MSEQVCSRYLSFGLRHPSRGLEDGAVPRREDDSESAVTAPPGCRFGYRSESGSL